MESRKNDANKWQDNEGGLTETAARGMRELMRARAGRDGGPSSRGDEIGKRAASKCEGQVVYTLKERRERGIKQMGKEPFGSYMQKARTRVEA